MLGKIDSNDINVLVGLESSDDACVYKIDEQKALVQTLDFITPVVDDPFVYGQIAAANSLSDVFAMGADVATALNIVGFDGCHHPKEVLKEILEGGQQKVRECGGIVIGGHSIDAPEMIYGLSVSGFVHPEKIYRNNALRLGDVIILTKPIGMGVMTTSIKADMVDEKTMLKVAQTLSQLNYKASLAMREFDVGACTDVTGFGLLGHANEMSDKKFTLEFDFNAIPILKEAKALADMGIIPAGTYNNRAFLSDKVEVKNSYKDEIFAYDAQTSGGLLISVSQEDAPKLLTRLKNEGYESSAIVATVIPKGQKAIILR